VRPDVSIILITHSEKPAYFAAALKACLAQKDVNLQVIVSTVANDPAIRVAKKAGVELVVDNHPNRRSVHQAFRQVNAGFTAATGDWIFLTGSDDLLLPTRALDDATMCLEYDAKVCYSAYYVANANLCIYKTYVPRKYSYEHHRTKGNFISDASMMSRKVWQRFGPFRSEEWNNHAYWDFWLRVAEGLGPKVFIRNLKPAWIYRNDPNSRHMRRRHDSVLRERDKHDRKRMLASHRDFKMEEVQ